MALSILKMLLDSKNEVGFVKRLLENLRERRWKKEKITNEDIERFQLLETGREGFAEINFVSWENPENYVSFGVEEVKTKQRSEVRLKLAKIPIYYDENEWEIWKRLFKTRTRTHEVSKTKIVSAEFPYKIYEILLKKGWRLKTYRVNEKIFLKIYIPEKYMQELLAYKKLHEFVYENIRLLTTLAVNTKERWRRLVKVEGLKEHNLKTLKKEKIVEALLRRGLKLNALRGFILRLYMERFGGKEKLKSTLERIGVLSSIFEIVFHLPSNNNTTIFLANELDRVFSHSEAKKALKILYEKHVEFQTKIWEGWRVREVALESAFGKLVGEIEKKKLTKEKRELISKLEKLRKTLKTKTRRPKQRNVKK